MKNPPLWDAVYRITALRSTSYKCHTCKAPNAAIIQRNSDGSWVEVDELIKNYNKSRNVPMPKVKLGVLRLNGVQWDCRPSNLRPFCQMHQAEWLNLLKDANTRNRKVWDPAKFIHGLNATERPLFLASCLHRLLAYHRNIEHMGWIAERRRYKGYDSNWDRAYNKTLLRLKKEQSDLFEATADSIWPQTNQPEKYIRVYLANPHGFLTEDV